MVSAAWCSLITVVRITRRQENTGGEGTVKFIKSFRLVHHCEKSKSKIAKRPCKGYNGRDKKKTKTKGIKYKGK